MNYPWFYTMINIDEVNSRLETYIEQNNMWLGNLEIKFEDLSLQMHDVQATLKVIVDQLGVLHNQR